MKKNVDRYDLLKVIDPVSSFLLMLTVMVSMAVLFSLNFSQVLTITVIDILLFLLTSLVDVKLFLHFFPRFTSHFPIVNSKLISSYSPTEKQDFVKLLLSFPLTRTLWVLALSFIKVLIPGILVVHVFSNSQNILFNWLCFWLLESLYILIIFSGLVFTSVSRQVYQVLSLLDQEEDLNSTFAELSPSPMRSELFIVENATLLSAVVAFIALTWASASAFSMNSDTFTWHLVVILISGFVSIGRVYYVNRRNFIEALNSVFLRLRSLDKGFDRYIPLHADSTLSNFEHSYNMLIKRLKNRDREIESWMAFQAEQNKMANIGESMSLVTHDMVSPLHAIEFCIDELLDDAANKLDRDEVQDYLAQAKFNLLRVKEMVDSVKYAAKNPQGQEKEAGLFESYSYALQLLKTHFSPGEMEGIVFYYDPKLVSAKAIISHTNLVHMLYNTMKNSVINLITHKIISPKIELISMSTRDDLLEFVIRDNGSGLSAFEFDKMTSKETLIDTRKGLGMRLTKRIIERYQGDMYVLPKPSEGGTDLYVKLPRSTYEER